MSTDNRNAIVNLEKKLADLNLSPAQHAQAVDAMRAAEDMVQFVETLGAAIKRIAGVFSLKHGARA